MRFAPKYAVPNLIPVSILVVGSVATVGAIYSSKTPPSIEVPKPSTHQVIPDDRPISVGIGIELKDGGVETPPVIVRGVRPAKKVAPKTPQLLEPGDEISCTPTWHHMLNGSDVHYCEQDNSPQLQRRKR